MFVQYRALVLRFLHEMQMHKTYFASHCKTLQLRLLTMYYIGRWFPLLILKRRRIMTISISMIRLHCIYLCSKQTLLIQHYTTNRACV